VVLPGSGFIPLIGAGFEPGSAEFANSAPPHQLGAPPHQLGAPPHQQAEQYLGKER